jgi:hypothetical protein
LFQHVLGFALHACVDDGEFFKWCVLSQPFHHALGGFALCANAMCHGISLIHVQQGFNLQELAEMRQGKVHPPAEP